MTWLRALCFVALGAAAFPAAPALVSRLQPPIVIDFAADPPPQLTAGFYPAEHTPNGVWFAWTKGTFGLALATLDRSLPWTVTVRLSGSRPDGTTPELNTTIDGVVRDHLTLPASGFVDHTLTIDPRPGRGRGLAITWMVSPTFVPGPADSRVLGAQVESIQLAPLGGGPRVMPDTRPLVTFGIVAGAVMIVLGLPWLAGTCVLVLLASGTAFILTRGLGPFVTFPWIAITIGSVLSAIVTMLSLAARSTAERLVVAITFTTVALQLLLLCHPDMPIGDAIFHTHRFQDVLGGHYLFASLAPGNYRFPYPIGLYLFARPFAVLTRTTADRMLLLRVIVVTVDACASALLYRLVMIWRRDDVEAVSGVVGYHVLPLGFGVIVTANLTNVFAQSLATVTLVLAGMVLGQTSARSGAFAESNTRKWLPISVVTAVAAAAFLSHTSTFAVLGTQVALAGLVLARASEPTWRPGGRILLVAAIAALVFSIGVYYAYFVDVYREAFARIASETGHATSAAGGRTPLTRLLELPWGVRISFGLPGIVLAVVGAVRAFTGPRSALGVLIATWLAVCGLFMIVGVITPVDLRHLLAALPVVGILAGIGFTWLWRGSAILRALAVALAAWMSWVAAVSWTGTLGGR